MRNAIDAKETSSVVVVVVVVVMAPKNHQVMWSQKVSFIVVGFESIQILILYSYSNVIFYYSCEERSLPATSSPIDSEDDTSTHSHERGRQHSSSCGWKRLKSAHCNRSLSSTHSYSDNSYSSPGRKSRSKSSPSRQSHRERRSATSRKEYHPHPERRSSSNHSQELVLANPRRRSQSYQEENRDHHYGMSK